jgi:predicted homoserine dehydrogenase-like protein
MVEVITVAKREIAGGESLDGIGGFDCYGLADNADLCRANRYLPMSLSKGCRLRRDISKDDIITYQDVDLPEGRLSVTLRAEQDAHFRVTS